jgi:hypothetical protein
MANGDIQKADGATASLVCGIIGNVAGCLIIPGVVLGIIAILKYKQTVRLINESGGKLKGKGQAIAGLILGIVSLASVPFWILYIIYIVAIVKTGGHF